MQELKAKFDEYYNCRLLGKFAELEIERHRMLNIFIKRLLLTGIFIPILILLFWSSFWGDYIAQSQTLTDITIYILAAYVLISAIYCCSPIDSFLTDVKHEIMKDFSHFWGDFEYSFRQSLPDKTITNSQLFPFYDNKSGDDYFHGNYQGIQTIISEELLTKKVRTKNGSHNVTVFRGVVILLEMNKKFKGKTIVLKDRGFFNIFKRIGGKERVKLEDVVFERRFEVFADDQIEARYLLTTAFMERILKVKDAFRGQNIQFSFFDNKLLIAIETKCDMFEVSSLFRRTTNRKMIDRAFSQFASVMEIIDHLKLR